MVVNITSWLVSYSRRWPSTRSWMQVLADAETGDIALAMVEKAKN
jgi:hypothetical protein